MFICLEGIAGAGKTTQSLLLKERLEREFQLDILISKAFESERKVQAQIFMENLGLKEDDIAVMFVFQALHAAQFTEVSKALSQGKFIIADRWRETFLAYHASFGPLAHRDSTILGTLDNLAFRDLDADLTFHLDVSAEVAHQRYVDRERNEGVLRTFDVASFDKFRRHYQGTAVEKGWTTIDASRYVQAVHEEIWGHVSPFVEEKASR